MGFDIDNMRHEIEESDHMLHRRQEEAKRLCLKWCETCGFTHRVKDFIGTSWFGVPRICKKITIFEDKSVVLEEFGLSEGEAWMMVLMRITEGFYLPSDVGGSVWVEAVSEDELWKMLTDAQRDD